MPYLRNEPIATDDLDVSQPKLAGNTNASDDSFGVDHYQFSDLTTKNGKHKQVTTRIIPGAVHPATISLENKLYSMIDSPEIGLIQYSRGKLNAVPSPVTFLQSPATPITITAGTSSPILDFSNVTNAMFSVYTSNMAAGTASFNFEYLGWWIGAPTNLFQITTVAQGGGGTLIRGPTVTTAGTILQVTVILGSTTLSKVFWTLKFHRIW